MTKIQAVQKQVAELAGNVDAAVDEMRAVRAELERPKPPAMVLTLAGGERLELGHPPAGMALKVTVVGVSFIVRCAPVGAA